MNLKMTVFIVTLFLSVCSLSGNAQTTIPKGKAQLIEFTNATAKFTVPEGKSWYIYSAFMDNQIVNYTESNYDMTYILIKSLNGKIHTDLTKNIYGTRLYAGRSGNCNISYPLILPEKTIIEFIILAGEYNKSKLWNGTGYLCIIETDN